MAPEERIERIRAAATQNIASDDAAKLRSLWSSTTPCEEAQKGAPSQATDEVAQTIPLQTKLSSEGRLKKRKMTKVAVGSRIKSKTKQKNEKKKRMVAEWKAAKAAAAEEAKASAAARRRRPRRRSESKPTKMQAFSPVRGGFENSLRRRVEEAAAPDLCRKRGERDDIEGNLSAPTGTTQKNDC